MGRARVCVGFNINHDCSSRIKSSTAVHLHETLASPQYSSGRLGWARQHRCLAVSSAVSADALLLHPNSPRVCSPPSPLSLPKHVFILFLLRLVFPCHSLTAATAFRLGVAPLDVLPRRPQRLPPPSSCPWHILAVVILVIAVLPPTRRRNEDAGSAPAGTAATDVSA